MKSLRKMTTAALLACVFAVSVNAGDMHAGITDPPPPPPTSETADGEMDCGLTASVVALLQGVLSVL